MKKQVNPLAAVAAVLVLLGIAAFAFWRHENSAPLPPTAPGASAMPPQVTEELQKRMGGVQPPPR
jgi:hypothetical protein